MAVECQLWLGWAACRLFSYFWLHPISDVCMWPPQPVHLSSVHKKEALTGPPGLPSSMLVAWGIFGKTDLWETSSGRPERGLEGKIRASGRSIHLGLQLPHPHRSGHSLGRPRWNLQNSELKMPFCLIPGWFYKLKAICLNQETALVLLKFTLNSWVFSHWTTREIPEMDIDSRHCGQGLAWWLSW